MCGTLNYKLLINKILTTYAGAMNLLETLLNESRLIEEYEHASYCAGFCVIRVYEHRSGFRIELMVEPGSESILGVNSGCPAVDRVLRF